MKKHIKTLSAPKSWPLERKSEKFVTRPFPKSRFAMGIPLTLAIRKLGYAQASMDIKRIIQAKEVLVDKKLAKTHRILVGLMDTLEFPSIKKAFRCLINQNGVVYLAEADDASVKPCRITGKSAVKGKIQIATHDSRTLITDKNDYKVGDTIVLKLPEGKITEHIKLEKGVFAYLSGGKRKGRIAKVQGIEGQTVRLSDGPESFETRKEFVFAVGKEKPIIKL